MSDVKVCNTDDLITLLGNAMRNKFNRQVDADVLGFLDPEGAHLVVVALPFHNLDHTSIPHHRCNLYLKAKGKTEPIEGLFLDVAVSDFDRLTDAGQILTDA